ncbi:MAG TPA: TIGR03857 family LLM class F420-dependent oxidoreductase [Acidimicrobiales bacterium]|nr:TIGR03857 family LLM class F420-dependent oxidoreductase [Acidimicrobiales bacterium]
MTEQPNEPQLHELAFYGMAGAARDPKALLTDVRDAERIGLGSVFVSERFNVKEAVTLCGAVGAATTTLGIATGVTNHNTRHPVVTASFATTMDKLTDGRFALGLGRGIAPLMKAFGLGSITTAQLEDFAGLMRNLWQNEMVFGHNGPAGNFPFLRVDWGGEGRTIPLLFTAFGPHSLDLGGRVFDGVILHTFFTDETLARCVATIRAGAEQAGRDPDSVRIWSCLATVGDHIPYELRLKKTVGRMATYLQAYGDLMVETNRWDPALLQQFRASDAVTSIPGAIDDIATTEQLERVAEVIPAEWLAAAATGTPDQCVDVVNRQFELGATGVILHGATPAELEPIVGAYRDRRTAEQFAHLSANPGRCAGR